MSGGYAGAKRMLWFMAKYANGVAEQKGPGHPLPGDRAAADHRRQPGSAMRAPTLTPGAAGIETEAFFWHASGAPMPPRDFGEKVLSVLDDPQYGTGFAFGLKGR